MSKINLNNYTDEEILEALLELKFSKMMPVMTGLSKVFERINTRGQFLALRNSEKMTDEYIERLLKGEHDA